MLQQVLTNILCNNWATFLDKKRRKQNCFVVLHCVTCKFELKRALSTGNFDKSKVQSAQSYR